MGRAIGLKKAMFAGARIAGKHDPTAPQHMIYVPAHMKDGQFISQRSSFSAYVNSNRGKKDATGKVLGDVFNFTAWGKLADATARSCSVGRALDLECTPTSFLKPIVDAAGNPVMNRAGTQLQIPTVSFRIDNIVFAEEAAEVIAREVQEARRPPGWDNRSDQQAQTLWRQICAQNNAKVADFAAGTFVNARIIIPQGVGIQLVDPETRQPIAVPQATPAGNVAGVMAAAGTVMQPAAPPMAAPAGLPLPPAGYAYNAQGQLVQAAAPVAAPVAAPAAAGAVY
ncbi:hypothetical protein DRN34_03645 [Thermococci archaeon]|nr:MAG: hypothetical protein DRN34_03645 [Thermococci archaeon]